MNSKIPLKAINNTHTSFKTVRHCSPIHRLALSLTQRSFERNNYIQTQSQAGALTHKGKPFEVLAPSTHQNVVHTDYNSQQSFLQRKVTTFSDRLNKHQQSQKNGHFSTAQMVSLVKAKTLMATLFRQLGIIGYCNLINSAKGKRQLLEGAVKAFEDLIGQAFAFPQQSISFLKNQLQRTKKTLEHLRHNWADTCRQLSKKSKQLEQVQEQRFKMGQKLEEADYTNKILTINLSKYSTALLRNEQNSSEFKKNLLFESLISENKEMKKIIQKFHKEIEFVLKNIENSEKSYFMRKTFSCEQSTTDKRQVDQNYYALLKDFDILQLKISQKISELYEERDRLRKQLSDLTQKIIQIGLL